VVNYAVPFRVNYCGLGYDYNGMLLGRAISKADFKTENFVNYSDRIVANLSSYKAILVTRKLFRYLLKICEKS